MSTSNHWVTGHSTLWLIGKSYNNILLTLWRGRLSKCYLSAQKTKINTLAPGIWMWFFKCNFPSCFTDWYLQLNAMRTDNKSTMVQVMAWRQQATSHYLSQYLPRSMSSYSVTRPQWFYKLVPWRYGSKYVWFSRSSYKTVAWVLTEEVLSAKCHRTSLMKSQHWFR